MSLRKRGGIWWIDVVAPNGERIRRNYWDCQQSPSARISRSVEVGAVAHRQAGREAAANVERGGGALVEGAVAQGDIDEDKTQAALAGSLPWWQGS